MGSSSVDVRLFINPDSLPNVEGLRGRGKSKPSDSSPGQQLGSADENESKETKLGPEKPRFGAAIARLGHDWLSRFSGDGRQRAKLFRALAESSGRPLARRCQAIARLFRSGLGTIAIKRVAQKPALEF